MPKELKKKKIIQKKADVKIIKKNESIAGKVEDVENTKLDTVNKISKEKQFNKIEEKIEIKANDQIDKSLVENKNETPIIEQKIEENKISESPDSSQELAKEPKKNNSGIHLAVLLVLIILGSAGFIIWKLFPEKNKINNTQNSNLSSIANSNTGITVIAPSTGKEINIVGVPLVSSDTTSLTAKNAYDIILIEAKKWQADAVLVSLKSDKDIALDGKSDSWEGFFISASNHNLGFKITIENGVAGLGNEVTASAKKITVPTFAMDSGEAIKLGLGDLGASEVSTSSIRLFQETESGEWFWSIATDKGNITLKAR